MSESNVKPEIIWKKLEKDFAPMPTLRKVQAFEHHFCEIANSVMNVGSEHIKDQLLRIKKSLWQKLIADPQGECSKEHIRDNYQIAQLIFNLYATSIIHSHGALFSIFNLEKLRHSVSKNKQERNWNLIVSDFHNCTSKSFFALEMLRHIHKYIDIEIVDFKRSYIDVSSVGNRYFLPKIESRYWHSITMDEPFRGQDCSGILDIFRHKVVHRVFNYVVPMVDGIDGDDNSIIGWYMFNPALSEDEFTMLRVIADSKPMGWNKPEIRSKLYKVNGKAIDIIDICRGLCGTVLNEYKRLADLNKSRQED